MSGNHGLPRAGLVLCASCMSILMSLGFGCPEDRLFDAPPDLEPLWANVTTTYSYFSVGETETAGVNTNKAGDTLTYEWSITPPATLVGPNDGMTVSYTASAAGTATLVVIVTDPASGSSATSTTQVQFDDSNASTPSTPATPPTVEVGPDRTVAVGETVLLLGTIAGTSSSDYQGIWRQASGPVQTIVPEDAAWTEAITVLGTTPGTTVFEFIAIGYSGDTVTKTVTVEVTAPNPG